MVHIGLECKDAERVGGYRLHGDDPAMFKTRESFLTKDRAFPGDKYPTRQEVPQPASSTSSGDSFPPAGPAPSGPAPTQSEEMLVKMHRELVKMAGSLGVHDLCAADKRSRPENI